MIYINQNTPTLLLELCRLSNSVLILLLFICIIVVVTLLFLLLLLLLILFLLHITVHDNELFKSDGLLNRKTITRDRQVGQRYYELAETRNTVHSISI